MIFKNAIVYRPSFGLKKPAIIIFELFGFLIYKTTIIVNSPLFLKIIIFVAQKLTQNPLFQVLFFYFKLLCKIRLYGHQFSVICLFRQVNPAFFDTQIGVFRIFALFFDGKVGQLEYTETVQITFDSICGLKIDLS